MSSSPLRAGKRSQVGKPPAEIQGARDLGALWCDLPLAGWRFPMVALPEGVGVLSLGNLLRAIHCHAPISLDWRPMVSAGTLVAHWPTRANAGPMRSFPLQWVAVPRNGGWRHLGCAGTSILRQEPRRFGLSRLAQRPATSWLGPRASWAVDWVGARVSRCGGRHSETLFPTFLGAGESRWQHPGLRPSWRPLGLRPHATRPPVERRHRKPSRLRCSPPFRRAHTNSPRYVRAIGLRSGWGVIWRAMSRSQCRPPAHCRL